MTAGKQQETHALEENLAIISNSEPAQLLEEERLRKEIATVPKLNASLLLTPSIYVTRTTRSGPIPPARQ
ncbi:hypothetical protein ACLB1O_07795 [Escherichia coli]